MRKNYKPPTAEQKAKTEKILQQILKDHMEREGHTKHLDAALFKVKKIDDQIAWNEKRIKELEAKKQEELRRVNDIFELAVVTKHTLTNGYTVKVDNRHKIEITSVSDFLKWLKTNCKPQEVLSFFEDSIKLSKLKRFCDDKINQMKDEGKFESEIKIDGIKIIDVQYRRLTTETRKKK